ncbi:DUF2510 domain-containing protein [Actinacidiphila yeochonensis]|uniref:DUF2510 domain-containing protein n=1 Tax=Actinacidiphila yeochonensis TaxID=89050 RepID=UPI000568BF55|nr:DUF2510 domain-containing protein [Actinacidiphila yeochonensis]
MTTTTPPGWYPEPGHTGNGPAMERWWNGTEWTEYTRTAPGPGTPQQDTPQQGAQPYGQPQDQPYGVQPYGVQPYGGQPYGGYPPATVISGGGGGRRRTSTVVLSIVAALVVIGGVIAGVLVLGDNSSSDNKAQSTPSTAPSGGFNRGGNGNGNGSGGLGGDSGGLGGSGGQAPDTQQPESPGTGGKTVTGPGTAADPLDGISLPVLKGWTGDESTDSSTADVVTGSYPCPQDSTSTCVRGGVFAQPALALNLKSTTAEAAAKEDIAGNAEQAYGSDIYGKTTSHEQLASESVTVAGKQGYLVRWKVDTASGTSGYVESLAFPSPTRDLLVVIRFGFDVSGKAPGLDTMDTITKGIKASSGTAGSGGGGTGV